LPDWYGVTSTSSIRPPCGKSAATRKLAQDVAQTVFTDLARKAGSLARRESLTGWLYTSAHFAAAKIVRTENRRRNGEDKFMREPTIESSAGVSPATDWEKIRLVLDKAMHELKESDREAMLLRYFENRQFAEVAARLGLNENAARMRVERALDKLRAVFARGGITTAAALGSVISANAVQMAPAGLATTLVTTSIAAVGTGTAFTLLKFMTAAQFKLGISALVVAGAATALVIQHQTQIRLRGENESLRQQVARLQTENLSQRWRSACFACPRRIYKSPLNRVLRWRKIGRPPICTTGLKNKHRN
jgi:RNA polymerase sigma factor (sigma-70 family)